MKTQNDKAYVNPREGRTGIYHNAGNVEIPYKTIIRVAQTAAAAKMNTLREEVSYVREELESSVKGEQLRFWGGDADRIITAAKQLSEALLLLSAMSEACRKEHSIQICDVSPVTIKDCAS